MKNKWWKRNERCQWESRKHPSFLYISVRSNEVYRRVGNYHFTLIGTKPERLYVGKTLNDAVKFARKWVKKHSDKLK